MSTETTDDSKYNPIQSSLYLAFELGQAEWKLGFSIGFGQDPRIRTIKAGNRFIRAIAIEIAWSWLRYQPESKLSFALLY